MRLSSSVSAASGSASDSIGAAMRRRSYAKPQSSSSQRLNAVRLAIVAGTSCFSASSTPQPSVGKRNTAPSPWRSVTATRRVVVLVLGSQRFDLHQCARVDAIGDLAPEHQVEAARHDDRVECRVRNEPIDASTDEEMRVPAVVHRLHAPLLELRIEIAGKRVERFVIVVVGVDRLEVEGHVAPPPGGGKSIGFGYLEVLVALQGDSRVSHRTSPHCVSTEAHHTVLHLDISTLQGESIVSQESVDGVEIVAHDSVCRPTSRSASRSRVGTNA